MTPMNVTKSFLFASLIVAALSAVVLAQTETASNAPPKHATTATTTTTTATPAAPAPPAATMADIQVLRDALAAQQKQIEALQAQLRSRDQGDKAGTTDTADKANTKDQPSPPTESTTEAAAPAPSPATSSQPAKPGAQANSTPAQGTQVAQTFQAGSSDERIRNLERQIKGLGPVSFSGDIRLRGEPFFGGPSNESLDRVRGRVRARFNAFANLGDQFQAGITLASGDINDPTSTNQTLTGFYTRKTIALDQAFIQFTPKAFKPLTLVGGKFRYPWYNTELTWDKDLNPEGAAQTLAFNVASPVLKRIAFVGFELPFAEMAGTSSTDQRITQAITYGGQIQTGWSLGPRVTLNAYSGYYDFRGSDAIALALARASSKNPQTPLSGVLPSDLRQPGAGLHLHDDRNHHRHRRWNDLSNRSHFHHQRAVRLEVRSLRQHRTPRRRYRTRPHSDFIHRRLRSEHRGLRQPSQHHGGACEYRDRDLQADGQLSLQLALSPRILG